MVAVPAVTSHQISWRWLRGALVLAVVGAEIALVAPHFSRGGAALADLRWGWVAAAVACEVASIATWGRLRRSLLRAGGVDVPVGRMSALAAASSAISNTVPAGVAVSAGYLYRQLRRSGATAPLVAWTLSAAAVVSTLAFTILTMIGTVLDGDSSLEAIVGAGGLSLVAVAALIALLGAVTRHPRPLVRALRAVCSRLPFARKRGCDEDAAAVDRVVEQLTLIRPRARDWGLAFWFALANWATDLGCFVLCCYAVGADRLGIGVAVLAYVAGLATSSISLLPGGVGSVEAGLLVGLTHAGVAVPTALAGILTYRLVAYGLVAAVGWGIWAALRRRQPALTSPPA
jgi:putative heme transporter